MSDNPNDLPTRKFSFEDDANKPSWLAWDEILLQGECIRCGDAISSISGETANQALSRNIKQHIGCRPNEAELRSQERERQAIRKRLEDLRLYEAEDANLLVLRKGSTPGKLGALLRDSSVLGSKDPEIQKSIGRALLALADVQKRLGLAGGPGYVPKFAASEPWRDFVVDRIPQQRRAFDEYAADYTAGYANGYQGVADERRDASEVERIRKTILDRAVEKMTASIPLLQEQMDQFLKKKTAQMELRGERFTVAFMPEKMWVQPGVLGQMQAQIIRDATGPIIDLYIEAPDDAPIGVHFQINDMIVFDGPLALLRRNGVNALRTLDVGVRPGYMVFLRFTNRSITPVMIDSAHIVFGHTEPPDSDRLYQPGRRYQ